MAESGFEPIKDFLKRFLEHFVTGSYDFWHTRRRALFLLVVVFFLLTGLYDLTLSYSSDIQSMLPDKTTQFREDFELFSYAPFSRNVLISLETTDADSSDGRLEDSAEKITSHLKPPYFQQAICGFSQDQKIRLFTWIYDRLPCLITEEDLAVLRQKTTPDFLRTQMQKTIRMLHSPESVVLKDFLMLDPLGFRSLLLKKMQRQNLASGFSTESDYFLSRDNRHLLIIAETDIAITDYKRGRELLDTLYSTIDQHISEGVRYSVICGHRYTVANAETIQRDLRRVLVVSVSGLVVIFLFFLRRWSAIIVFAIPIASLLAGIAVTGLCFSGVSSVTVGFGAVLLGISADFGLHVFYGLQEKGKKPQQILANLIKPLLFCAFTTVGVFSVLLFSVLPGQRQLAVFSITGILTAMVLSLFVLPHFLPKQPVLVLRNLSLPRARKAVVFIWLLIILVCVVPAMRVKFDGNIKSIGMVSQEVLEDEIRLKSIWGGIRDQALVFSVGKTQEEALQKNDSLFYALQKEDVDLPFYSVAPLVPSLETQRANLSRWNRFWNQGGRKEALAGELEKAGRMYGFTAEAFEPFENWLAQSPEPFTAEDFIREGNDKMISPFLARLADDQYAALTFMPDEKQVLSRLTDTGLDVKIVSNQQFGEQLNRETVSDFTRFFCGALILIIVLLFMLFLDFKKLLLAFTPVLVGLIVMAAVMSSCGLKINLFNMVASILVIGLAADYGIFVVCCSESGSDITTRNAVLVSGLTTCVGFGSLILARHPSMHSIGITVAAGIIPSLLCAITLLPILCHRFLTRRQAI